MSHIRAIPSRVRVAITLTVGAIATLLTWGILYRHISGDKARAAHSRMIQCLRTGVDLVRRAYVQWDGASPKDRAASMQSHSQFELEYVACRRLLADDMHDVSMHWDSQGAKIGIDNALRVWFAEARETTRRTLIEVDERDAEYLDKALGGVAWEMTGGEGSDSAGTNKHYLRREQFCDACVAASMHYIRNLEKIASRQEAPR